MAVSEQRALDPQPGRARGVFPASGGIHVGTSVFSQKPDPRLSLPNPAQPMASFPFLFFFFFKKAAMLSFLSTNFSEASFKAGRMHRTHESIHNLPRQVEIFKKVSLFGPLLLWGKVRGGGGESLQKLETRAPYTREGLSSGQTIPPPLPEPCPGGNVNVTFHKPYPPCGLGHRLELAKICVRKGPCPG